MPVQKLDGARLHSSPLPLGSAWDGLCCAPGHEGAQPSPEELHEFCHLGYAAKCSRLPSERDCDAVRFSVARDQGSRLLGETGHRPTDHRRLEYDANRRSWISSHPHPRIRKMHLQSYLQRRMQSATTEPVSSANS